MIHTVYLDMDGVLVDFNKGVYKALGLGYDYESFHTVYNYFSRIGKSREDIDVLCTLDFWANLEWMHDGREIYNTVCDFFRADQIFILTHCMPNVDTPSGKMVWIEKNLPELRDRVILLQFGVEKSQLAKRGTLLIDDKDEAVRDFISEGGRGILVPRPWNESRDFIGFSVEAIRGAIETLI